jgi:hypothetical protein
MKRAVWFLGITSFALTTGCVSEQATPYEYRIPLADNSQGEDAARSCATSCDGMDPEHSDQFFECLQTCPDARVSQGASCTSAPADQPPASYCFTRYVAEEREDAETNQLVASLFVRIAAAGIAALVHSQDENGEHRGHEHAAHHERHDHRHRR